MTRDVASTAAALAIGNELLSGKVRDQNLHQLALTLRAIGIQLSRAHIIADDRAVIASEVAALSRSHDVVFTSGGIGPTHDDLTIEAVADAFGVGVRIDATMAQMLERAYETRLTEGHLRMALIPEGARLCITSDVAWPTVVMENVWILPGVPEIFRMKLAVVREHLRGSRTFATGSVYTQMEETELKSLLDRIVGTHQQVEVGSYPKWFDPTYKTKITFDADARDLVRRAIDDFLELLPEGEPQWIE